MGLLNGERRWRLFETTCDHTTQLNGYSKKSVSGEFHSEVKELVTRGHGAKAIHNDLCYKYGSDHEKLSRVPTQDVIQAFITSVNKNGVYVVNNISDVLAWGENKKRYVRTAAELEAVKNERKVIVLKVGGEPGLMFSDYGA